MGKHEILAFVVERTGASHPFGLVGHNSDQSRWDIEDAPVVFYWVLSIGENDKTTVIPGSGSSYMTTFDKREDAFEAKFAHDEELRFKATARRNNLLGL